MSSQSTKEISVGNGTVSTLTRETSYRLSLLSVIGTSLVIIAIGTLFTLSLRLFPTFNERVASLASILFFQSEPILPKNDSVLPTITATATSTIILSTPETALATSTATSTEVTLATTTAVEKTEPTPIKNTPPTPPIIEPGPITTATYPIEGTAPTKPTQNAGRIDLVSEIIEIGTLDRLTGAFTPTTAFKSTDRIAVRFQVKNIGGRESGSWYFNAVLPTFPSHIFTSESQPSLLPDARIEYTLGFDNVSMTTTTREFVVNADPANSIGEADESNNIAKISIDSVTP